MRGIIRNMANATRGMPITTEVQKRHVISRNSGFSSVVSVTVFGSSAMPQMGHEPGPSRTISGCMGQVHSVFAGASGSSGSSAMPHFGHAPGWSCRTSGSIGQTYADAGTLFARAAAAAEIADAGKDDRNFSGSALNFSAHPWQQK